MPKKKMQRFAFSAGEIRKSMDPAKKLLVEFSHLTTCHGFRQVTTLHRRPIFRFMWAVLIIGLFCGLGKELYDKLHEYTDHSIVTDLHEEYVSELEFPAVTICNINRFVKKFDELRVAKMGALVKATCESPNNMSNEWWKQAADTFHREVHPIGEDKYFLSEEIMSKGWKLNDSTLRHCSFEKEKCTLSNFTQIVTPMGSCYTFHANEGATQKVPGSSHGLELYIDINQFEYTRDERDSLNGGIKIMIHEDHETPNVHQFGPSVSSGCSGHIAIKKTDRHLMYKPWGKCDPEQTASHHEHYSVASCMEECAVEYIIDRCGCRPYWNTMFEVQECDAWTIINCAGKAEADFPILHSTETCNCILPCNFVTYEVGDISTYPSIEVSEFLSTHAYRNESSTDLKDIERSFDKLQRFGKDHVMLDVFYDKLSYTSLTERKAVSEISLMSDVGGLLGLWLGISIVTVAEFIQLAIDALECWIEHNKGNKIKKKDPNIVPRAHSAIFRQYEMMWEEDIEATKSNTSFSKAET